MNKHLRSKRYSRVEIYCKNQGICPFVENKKTEYPIIRKSYKPLIGKEKAHYECIHGQCTLIDKMNFVLL